MQGICTELRGFQSTPPRGRRLWRLMDSIGILNFNPRLREGGDRGACSSGSGMDISIHASAREATACFQTFCIPTEISIHASAREATCVNPERH